MYVRIRRVRSASRVAHLCDIGVPPDYARLRDLSRGSQGLDYLCRRQPGEQATGRKELRISEG